MITDILSAASTMRWSRELAHEPRITIKSVSALRFVPRAKAFLFLFAPHRFMRTFFKRRRPWPKSAARLVHTSAQNLSSKKKWERMNRFVLFWIFTWLCSITLVRAHMELKPESCTAAVVREIYICAKTKVSRPLRNELSAAPTHCLLIKLQLSAIYHNRNRLQSCMSSR